MIDYDAIVLTVDLPSAQEADHLHTAGTQGILVEELGPDAFLVELRVPCEDLVGGAWYEVMELHAHEFERLDPLKE